MANLGVIGTTGSFGGGIVRYAEKAVSRYAVSGDVAALSGTNERDASRAMTAVAWLQQAGSSIASYVYGGGITFE